MAPLLSNEISFTLKEEGALCAFVALQFWTNDHFTGISEEKNMCCWYKALQTLYIITALSPLNISSSKLKVGVQVLVVEEELLIALPAKCVLVVCNAQCAFVCQPIHCNVGRRPAHKNFIQV